MHAESAQTWTSNNAPPARTPNAARSRIGVPIAAEKVLVAMLDRGI
jgi:hypothetical protein